MKKLSKKTKKILVIILTILLSLFIINEIKNIYIDMYNFKQLEKAKVILDKISKDDYKFYTLDKFNKKYNADMQPIKNCYYVSNDNWNEQYIFWFKLESLLYKIKYKKSYFTYPKYDIPYSSSCVMWWGCINISQNIFIRTISNPCQD